MLIDKKILKIISGFSLATWFVYTLAIKILGIEFPYINIFAKQIEVIVITWNIIIASIAFKEIRLFLFVGFIVAGILQYFDTQKSWLPYFMLAMIVTPTFKTSDAMKSVSVIKKKITWAFKEHFWIAIGFCLLTIVFVFYNQSFGSYFEGDEWIFFRAFRDSSRSSIWFVQGFIDTFAKDNPILHAAPVANMLYVIQYKLFGLNFGPYLVQSLITHALTALALGYFIFQISQSRKVGILSALIFATISTHSQAVTWTLASIFTTTAYLFCFVSVIFFTKFIKENQKKHLYLSAFFFLLGLLTKETALSFVFVFPAIYVLFETKKKTVSRTTKYFWWHIIALGVFGVVELVFRHGTKLGEETNTTEFIYNYIFLTSKSFSQGILPSNNIQDLAVWATDFQFPFFNAEKEVRGTTYLSFIQGPAYEFISHILTLLFAIITFFLIRLTKYKKILIIAVVLFFAGTIPLSLIYLKFPWWRFQAIVDSRHLYSVTPSIAIFVSLAIVEVSNYLHKKIAINTKKTIIILTLAILYIQFVAIQYTIVNHQEDTYLKERKQIVESMQGNIEFPPKKMIIYTNSSNAYYGFAAFILPFQTAFSQTIPVLFDEPHHKNGHVYPSSFYRQEFIGDAGLVSEGYVKEGDYAIGYFLDKYKLMKVLEKEDFPLENLYGYDFNHKTNELNDTSYNIRATAKSLLESRKQIKNWPRYGSKEEGMTFQANQNWDVIRQIRGEEIIYTVIAKSNPIMTITMYDPNDRILQTFVSEQTLNGIPINDNFMIRAMDVDLDSYRTIYIPELNENIKFMSTADSSKYYKVEYFDNENADLIRRTFEFVDNAEDVISLPDNS